MSDAGSTFSAFAQKLAALDAAGVKALFGKKTVAALEALGLEGDAASTLREVIAEGVGERVVFILFLKRLLEGCPDELGGSVAAQYIARSHGRLSAAEKNLPRKARDLFDGLF